MESKQAKTPALSSKTKLLCFDVEANGLHGEAFAVGAVVMDSSGQITKQFTGRVKIIGEVDPWVQKNVLPAIENMPVTHNDYKELREGFWKWYLEAETESDYVLVSNGYPVEYRFLIQCQEENLSVRYWQHPFPILELFSLLVQVLDSPADRNKLAGEILRTYKFLRHNPLDDAKASALTAFQLFRMAGKIK